MSDEIENVPKGVADRIAEVARADLKAIIDDPNAQQRANEASLNGDVMAARRPLPKARFRVSPYLLRQRLEMPTRIEIVGAFWDVEKYVVVLEIADWGEPPVLPTERLGDGTPKYVEPIITKEELKWDFSHVEEG